MKIEHTPGPWKVFEDDFNEILIQYKDGVVVDRVGTLVSNDEIDNEKLRADAKLIAAAPDLLEALDEIQLDTMIDADDLDLALKALAYIRDTARQAIKKATEEEDWSDLETYKGQKG